MDSKVFHEDTQDGENLVSERAKEKFFGRKLHFCCRWEFDEVAKQKFGFCCVLCFNAQLKFSHRNQAFAGQ